MEGCWRRVGEVVPSQQMVYRYEFCCVCLKSRYEECRSKNRIYLHSI